MVETTNDTGPKGERIAKRLARAGLCSRRDAERWIAAGRVRVDGRVLESPAFNVLPHHRVEVDGQPLPGKEPTALWRYHKPAGLVTTNRDPQGRETIFDRLPPELPRVMTVGRLDLTTEGLLLLTNDGDLARFLELPSTGWTRRYRVRVNGWPDEAALARLADGVAIDGMRYGPVQARLDRQQGANAWLTMTIREGKNREIRKVCEHLGLTANRLIRTAYGPFQLGKLETSAVDKVPARVLREQVAHWSGLSDTGDAAGPARKPQPKSPPKSPNASPGKTEKPARSAAKSRPRHDDRGRNREDGPSAEAPAPPKKRSRSASVLRLKPGGKAGRKPGGKPGAPFRSAGSENDKPAKNAHRRRKP